MPSPRLLVLAFLVAAGLFASCQCAAPAAGGKEGEGEHTGSGEGEGAAAGEGEGEGEGEGNTCSLVTCASAGASCGPIGDGCDGVVQCGTCTSPATCGGGNVPSTCGGDVTTGGGCAPLTCAALQAECGVQGDGCGNTIDCGSCSGGDLCGNGGPSKCGPPGTVNACVPLTCAAQGIGCGPAGDGCGGQLDCGGCTGTDVCGGGGPGQCGPPPPPPTCTPSGTCGASNCGVAADGCGGSIACGSCGANQSCGTLTSGQCGPVAGTTPSCTPRTCADVGANCGQVADGCGGLTASCGSCSGIDICGGTPGLPNVCGHGSQPGGGGTCTNLCLQQQTCANGNTTSVSGTVFAPNGTEPLYDALVYIPNAPVAAFAPGVACLQCDAEVSGSPLVSATTGPDGKFILPNAPVGTNIPLVIQLGRWRRQVVIPNVPACTNTQVPASLTHLPKNRSQGDIPLTAMVTGDVDTLECVLRKMGVDDSEFGDPLGNNRIQLFVENGAAFDNNTPFAATDLYNDSANLDRYDQVLFACEGFEDQDIENDTASRNRVLQYANAGGRVFTTHFSYVWDFDTPPWGCGANCTTAGQTVATWNPNQSFGDNVTSTIDTTFQKGADFSQWIDVVNAASPSAGSGHVDINVIRHDFDSTIAPAQQWLFTTDPNFPVQHMTWNTPVDAPAANQCGRVLYSDFHVADFQGAGQLTFPDECQSGSALTPQEKVLEFMLFDLASCIKPDNLPPPTCTPITSCAAVGANCGPISNGCGGVIQCGNCPNGETCGAGGPSVCGGPVPACVPKTCAELGFNCGAAGDGCGNTLDCGSCTAPQICGGGGVPGQCGGGTGSCAPTTCSALGFNCGPAGNGCGGLLQCGTCNAPQTCGGAGVPGQCGAGGSTCAPKTCTDLGVGCGPAGDGCGGLLQCGDCASPQTCGGAGVPGRCGVNPTCTPTTCAAKNAVCGAIADGCGGLLHCGDCTPPAVCGGGGVANQCGTCAPTTCAAQNAQCGSISDGCGNTLDCGTCPSSFLCTPTNQCVPIGG